MHKIFFYNKFILRIYMFRALSESYERYERGLLCFQSSPLSTCAPDGHLQVWR